MPREEMGEGSKWMEGRKGEKTMCFFGKRGVYFILVGWSLDFASGEEGEREEFRGQRGVRGLPLPSTLIDGLDHIKETDWGLSAN